MKKTIFCLLLALPAVVTTAGAGGAIHGTIETRDGLTLTGPIRWDANENFWDDRLNARKGERLGGRTEEDGFKLSLFGWEIVNSDRPRGNRDVSLPFGHLASIEPLSGNEALLVLKNGEEMEVKANSTDIGNAMRDLIIEDAEQGKRELSWWQLKKVTFSKGSDRERDAERLYGTVVSGSGNLTGFIVWDRDESMLGDVLDGEDEDNRDHAIPFRDIAEIERLENGSLVKLKSAEPLKLHGTNDVAAGHRGIIITLRGVGSAKVDWRNVSKVTFEEPPASDPYDSYDGGSRLRGKVTCHGGASYAGLVIWDLDEAYSWETLDGSIDGIDYAVEFANIKSITPRGYESSEVLLRNGTALLLSGTNDVNGSNEGVQVIPDGSNLDPEASMDIILEWDELEKIEFE
jgi:hypothetical protein